MCSRRGTFAGVLCASVTAVYAAATRTPTTLAHFAECAAAFTDAHVATPYTTSARAAAAHVAATHSTIALTAAAFLPATATSIAIHTTDAPTGERGFALLIANHPADARRPKCGSSRVLQFAIPERRSGGVLKRLLHRHRQE